MILDVILVLASVFVVGKKLFLERGESNNEVLEHRATSKGLSVQIILSLAVIWSFLSFPMIYWNHNGEWWPFFDDIPILRWPLQPFYASHNLFLLASLLGVVLIAFLLSSFTNRGEAIQLVKRGLSLGKEKKWRNMVVLSIPALIGIFYLLLEILDVIPKVDWLMFAIMYPLIVTMPMILIPYAEKMGIKKQDFPQDRTRTNLPS
jgi:H+/Cl- antiporter ClcA